MHAIHAEYTLAPTGYRVHKPEQIRVNDQFPELSGLLNFATWTEVIYSPLFRTGHTNEKAMDVGLSTMTRWVRQLHDEHQGKTPKASPITPEQIEIRELRKKSQRIEMENEMLKKVTAFLMSGSPEQFSIIGKLRAHYPVVTLCRVFRIHRSSYK